MKFLLVLICSLSVVFSNAQNCTGHALMRKGVQLEYNLYMVDMNGFGKMSSTDLKVSRILFEVDNVTEDDGSIYSTIIKRGFSLDDEKDHFERRIVLKCDGKNLRFPLDFYSCDTIYARDVYPKEKRGKHGFAFAYAPMEDAITYIVPLIMEGINNLPEGKKQVTQRGTQRSWTNRGLVKSDFESNITIKSIKLVGKETVKTEAGSFACYKLYVDSDQKTGKFSMPLKYWLFFNAETGLVKMETPGGNIELVSVKK